ncbi:MAG: hypothetical protein GXP62_06340, partial [Oligoflexia bacterium]|nr:hypothetical protein [Oligoflexia bacterium]
MADALFRTRDAAGKLGPPVDPHPGLVFERFPRLLSKKGPRYDIVSGDRREWLKVFIARLPTAAPLLARHHARMDAVAEALQGQRRLFSTVGRLAIGLGNPNAGDIGFSLDHATGMP